MAAPAPTVTASPPQQISKSESTVQREAAPDPYKENWSALSSTHLLEGQNET
jgi:hypothetical protein